MLYLVVFIVLVLAAFYAYFCIKNRQMIELANKFPGPRAFPLIGNVHLLIGKRSEEMFPLIQSMCTKYGTPVRIWIGPILVIYINRPIDIQRVLNSPACLDKMYIYKLFGWEQGVLSADAAIWRIHRKVLNPCFGPNILQTFVPIFVEKSRVMVDRLRGLDEADKFFDIFEYLSACTLDTICATTLGFNIDAQNSSNNLEFVQALEKLFPIINQRIFNIMLHPFIVYSHTRLYQNEVELRKKISETTNKIIGSKSAELRRSSKISRLFTINEPDTLCCKKNLISELLKQNMGEYTHEALRQEIEGIIVVGNETTALTSAFVVLMLAIHNDVQDNVYREIERVYKNENATYVENLSELRYMEMVIKETLRLFPAAPIIVKKATDNVELHDGTIPKGANVAINIFSLHRDPAIWGENAESFKPDRFAPLEIKYRHPYSFIPFSGGKRICLGYKYAMLSMKIMLVELLRTYKFHTELTMNDLQPEMNITLKLKNKHLVGVTRRHRRQK